MLFGQSPENELSLLDRVLVETDIDGLPVSFQPVVVRICSPEVWLGLAAPAATLERLQADQPVQLTVSHGGTTQASQSRFLRQLDPNNHRVFSVAWPGVPDPVQRRAHLRYQFDWPVHFRRLDPATLEPRGTAEVGTTVNVSAGGLLFESDVAMTVGEELELTLPLSGGADVKVHGTIVRVQGLEEEDAPRPDGRPGRMASAVKFTRITAVDQERMVRFILLTEHRHRDAGSPLGTDHPAPGQVR